MTEALELRKAPDVKQVVLTAFPEYRKRKAYVSEFRPMNINSYWSEGSRDEYAIVELATMRRHVLPTSTHPYFDIVRRGMANSEDEYVVVDHVGNVTMKGLPEGFALVRAGFCCGKPATAHIYLNAANLPKAHFLPHSLVPRVLNA